MEYVLSQNSVFTTHNNPLSEDFVTSILQMMKVMFRWSESHICGEQYRISNSCLPDSTACASNHYIASYNSYTGATMPQKK